MKNLLLVFVACCLLPISGYVVAKPKEFTPVVIERHSSKRIYIGFGPSLKPSSEIDIQPIINPLGTDLEIEKIELMQGGGGLFEAMWLVLKDGHEMQESLDYALFIKKLGDDVFLAENKLFLISRQKGKVTLSPKKPRTVDVEFTSSMDKSLKPEVKITRHPNSESEGVDVSNVEYSGDTDNRMIIELDYPLHRRDAVEVTAKTTEGVELTAKSVMSNKKPANKDASSFYLSLSHVDNKGEDSTLNLDFKYDQRNQLESSTRWQSAWFVNAQVDTSSTSEVKKGDISFFLNKNWITEDTRNQSATVWRFSAGPKLEIDNAANNRNILANVELRPVSTSLHRLWGGTATLQPILGVELGKNLRLKDKYKELEDYDIQRLRAGLVFSKKWYLNKTRAEDLTFTLDYTGRYLFSDEVKTVPIPEVEQVEGGDKTKLVVDDGYKDNLTASLLLGLNDYFSFVLKYENGETPMFYQDVDRFSIAFTYLY